MIYCNHLYHMSEVYHLGELRLSIPNKIHKALKQIALDKGVSLKQLILNIFENHTVEVNAETNKTNKEG